MKIDQKVSRDVDNVYLNTQLYNPSDRDFPCSYSAQFTDPVLGRADEYCVSVSRFSFDVSDVPLFIFKDNTYSITLQRENSGQVARQFLIYSDVDAVDSRQVVYTFSHMVDMVNAAFANAFGALAGGGGPNDPTEAPVMEYDPGSGLFSLIVQPEYARSNADRINIFFNYRLEKFFQSFYSVSFGNAQPDGMDRQIVVAASLTNGIQIGGNDYIKVEQDFDSRISFYEMKSIVIRTSTLPMRHEFAAPVKTDRSTWTGDITLDILSDYSPFSSTPQDQRSRMIYSPTVYRWADLIGEGVVKQIDYSVFWEDLEGNFYPLVISPHNFASLKLLFRKKSKLT